MPLISPAGGPSSSLVNDQLVSTADSWAIAPPGSVMPYLGLGSAPSNLPAASSPMGAAIGGAGGVNFSADMNSSSATNLGSVAADLRNVPLWQNPVVWWIVALFIGYGLLRGVFWS